MGPRRPERGPGPRARFRVPGRSRASEPGGSFCIAQSVPGTPRGSCNTPWDDRSGSVGTPRWPGRRSGLAITTSTFAGTSQRPSDGALALEALRFARWPRGWYAEWQGPPPYTTVAIKAGRRTVGRAYCRNTKLRNGGPRLGKIRFERQRRFDWADGLDVEALASDGVAAFYWESVFGEAEAGSRVLRIPHEVLAQRLIDLVAAGEISTGSTSN